MLFGIFFFPILFQSIHIVWHHSHDYKCEHQLCHTESSDKDSNNNSVNISQHEKICPICEYQFSINDLPRVLFSKAIVPLYICTLFEINKQQQNKQIFTDKSPRAPPIIVL